MIQLEIKYEGSQGRPSEPFDTFILLRVFGPFSVRGEIRIRKEHRNTRLE